MPQLLDPHLEAVISPIILRLLAAIKAFPTMPTLESKLATFEQHLPFYSLLFRLAKTRGHKVIVRFFTHEVADLEPVLAYLEFIAEIQTLAETRPAEMPPMPRRMHSYWEMRYILLLWISLIAMVPFDLARVDSGSSDGVKLVDRMLDLAKRFIGAVGVEYDGAAVLIMRVLTRKDVSQTHLIPFIDWAFDGINTATETFRIRGLVTALCAVYKHAPRNLLLPTVHYASTCCALFTDKLVAKNSLMRKLVIKLAQRIALCSLKPRVAAWRYQRGARSLADNLAAASSAAVGSSSGVGGLVSVAEGGATATADDADADTFDDVTEETEETIGLLIEGLRDKDTVVRWTAAKGVGRLANRLSYELADDIVGSVIEILGEDVVLVDGSPQRASVAGASDASWHGALLALAELARRGLLLEPRMRECMPWVMRALSFDQRRGTHSVGAHVRDAACYVCWSFARAYAPQVLEPFAGDLARCLVVTSVTDREINIRRASSAAFQENVGRHGLFPRGIDIMGLADYFNLGNRNNTFGEIVPAMAKYAEYGTAIVEHLADATLRHWDRVMRDHAATALGLIAASQPDLVCGGVFQRVLAAVVSDELDVRHGALLATARILAALARSEKTRDEAGVGDNDDGRDGRPDGAARDRPWPEAHMREFVEPAFRAVHAILPAHTESFGSDLTRAAAAELAEALAATGSIRDVFELHGASDALRQASEAGIDGTAVAADGAGEAATSATQLTAVLAKWWRLVDTSLDRAEEDVQEAAARAAGTLAAATGLSAARLQAYLHGLAPTSPVYRRAGVALALGRLTRATLAPHLGRIVSALADAVRVQGEQVYNSAEARRNAVEALTAIVEAHGGGVGGLGRNMDAATLQTIVGALLAGTRDYSTDSRGDVGSWVREASVQGLAVLVRLLDATPRGPDAFELDGEARRQAFAAMCQQSVEKIDRVRERAAMTLVRLVWDEGVVVPARAEMQAVLPRPQDAGINWLNPRAVFPIMVRLLHVRAVRAEVLTGLVVSMGSLTESLVRHSSSALVEFLGTLPRALDASETPNDVLERVHVLDALVQVFVAHHKDERVSVPVLETVDVLLNSAMLTADDARQVVHIFELTKTEVFKSKNVKKLAAAIKVFAGLAALVDAADEGVAAVQTKSLKQLVLYLAHPYPSVRRAVSESLYLLVSASLSSKHDADALAEAEDLLITTDWDTTPVAELKTLRSQIEAILLAA
nr:hypothetical protein HK105_000960 [Polyrhizophydium stewartii]